MAGTVIYYNIVQYIVDDFLCTIYSTDCLIHVF